MRRAKARGYREGYGSGLAWGALLCLAVFLGVMTLSHWYYSPADVLIETRGGGGVLYIHPKYHHQFGEDDIEERRRSPERGRDE